MTETSTRPRISADRARSWMLRSPLAPSDAVGPDALVLDLEDGLAPDLKDEGREAAVAVLGRREAWVRVCGHGTPAWDADLRAVGSAAGLEGIVLAETASAAQVEATAERLPTGTRIVALIESAIGLERALSIASHPATFRLAFGSGDFRRDTGMADDPVVLSWPRARLVVASAAAGIPAPIDGPCLGSPTDALAAARHALAMGMTGKLVLRDDHLAPLHEGLSPTTDAIRDAIRILDGPAQGDGSYAPARARAELLLERAAAFGLAAAR